MLYKYFPLKYLEEVLEEGSILFRTLSYFKEIDQTGDVRRDNDEGNYYFQPKPEHQSKIIIDGRDVSKYVMNIRAGYSLPPNKNIMITCFSQKLCKQLWQEFAESDKLPPEEYCCIEIRNKAVLLETIVEKLQETFPKIKLIHGPVEYFDSQDDSMLGKEPERYLWFYKTHKYRSQEEYRISFYFDKGEENFGNDSKMVLDTGVQIFSSIQVIKVCLQEKYANLIKLHKYN